MGPQTDEIEKLHIKFDLNTIEHLGVSMYSKLPPVVAELVANAWDADAKNVTINFYDADPSKKRIVIWDDGCGMTRDDINGKFLIIGRNQRVTDKRDVTVLKRKVIGKKGIGKLSIFGIANEVTITTIKNKLKNQFRLSLDEIRTMKDAVYFPKHLIDNEECETPDGTVIELTGLKRKAPFEPKEIARDLARRFQVFDESFKLIIIHNDDNKNPIEVTNRLRFEALEVEFEWDFPNAAIATDYDRKLEVSGKIYSTTSPLPVDMKGIFLVARGKLVNSNEFYGLRDTDYSHAYLTGWLTVDFVDDDPAAHNISTNRESLNWENEIPAELRKYLQTAIRFVSNDWDKKRNEKKIKRIKEVSGVDVHEWVQSLPEHEQKIAEKITNVILKSPSMEVEKASQLVTYVKDAFGFESFKSMANKISESENRDVPQEDILQLLQEWKIVESKEMYKLAIVRIQTIQNFKKFIEDDVKEKLVQDFLIQFPWILDPRIMKFEDEVYYSNLLRNQFKEDEKLESDRRIDFVCVDLANTLFIIELKRPGHYANVENLQQALEYQAFVSRHVKGFDGEGKRPVAFLVCKGLVNAEGARSLADSLRKDGKVYVRTYADLLQSAINYHKEFIQRYVQLGYRVDL